MTDERSLAWQLLDKACNDLLCFSPFALTRGGSLEIRASRCCGCGPHGACRSPCQRDRELNARAKVIKALRQRICAIAQDFREGVLIREQLTEARG